MNNKILGLIGYGRMGKTLVQCLTPRPILCTRKRNSDPDETYPSNVIMANSNLHLAHNSDIILLSVDPDNMQKVCKEIQEGITKDTCIISMAAGIRLETLREWNPNTHLIIRAMTNISCKFGIGAVTYMSNDYMSRRIITNLFSPNTIVRLETDEQMNMATVLSSCVPATEPYYKLARNVLDEHVTNTIVSSSMMGVSHLLKETNIENVIDVVSSRKGQTYAGLNAFTTNMVQPSIYRSLNIALSAIHAIENKHCQ